MNLPATYSKENGNLNVIIETPEGSSIKYKFDKENSCFKLHKYMPVGTCFPFDFGFIPHTKGGDGDPLDVIVLSDFPSAVGTVIECRIIGVIMAKQKEKGKRFNHNDRLVAVPVASLRYEEVKTIHGLGDSFLKRIITFFEHYNAMQNREFKLLDIKNSSHAVKLIEQSASEQ